jgi:hypothetical protein
MVPARRQTKQAQVRQRGPPTCSAAPSANGASPSGCLRWSSLPELA